MIRKKNAAPLPSASSAPASTSSPPPTNGAPATPSASAPASPSSKEKEGSLTRVESDFNAPPVVPRGLINNGNLCFINSILQVLVYTTPFWNLVGRLRKGTKADLSGRWVTLDAMMRFLEEFRPAPRIEVVSRSRTKSAPGTSFPSEDTFIPPSPSSYSEPFIPEEVYDSLKPNKRFDAMRRGHQEDAEEFLGFFLETLHDEVLGVMDREEKRSKKVVEESEGEKKEEGKDKVDGEGADGWLEVGSKGRTATTRTTETRQSPITKIFGGQLRSVLRCPGQKDSITLEPYQRLQLDISPPNVRTVEEALQNLTTPEALPDFVNRAGIRVEATKQVYLESYPPVLILHLKRFLYDNVGGVQKSGKVIGYGTELTIDEKIVAPNKRTGKPIRYQLYGVVYHHGKSASGGHYTVAVRQQINSNSWVHIDDTSIRPISPGDVAVDRSAGGSMENRGGSDGYGEKNAYLLCYRLVT
ncbi:cysteine proteinase [Meredithblackwellia eburnea MCA 4105]